MSEHDIAIIGGGPAGASCAVWLKRLGLKPLLIEASDRLGGAPARSPYPNPWVATSPGADGPRLAAAIARSVAGAEVATLLGHRVEALSRAEAPSGAAGFSIRGGGPGGAAYSLLADIVVIASGVRPRRGGHAYRPEILVGPGGHILGQDFSGLSVAILGGGDNAFEHYGIIRGLGAREVHIYARSVRAGRALQAAVPSADLTVGAYAADDRNLTVGGRAYDRIIVLYGYEPVTAFGTGLGLATNPEGYLRTDPATAETSVRRVFAIGEVANRMHPSVVTAMADGVVAAKAIQRIIEGERPP